MSTKVKGLRERLRDGESVICAEGYLWELERRGYLRSGVYTPEIVLDQPERVLAVHEEFAHAGSDVMEAFTYYGHREKLRLIGREDDLEKLNLKALQMAREMADKHGCLMAGNLSNTTFYDPDDADIIERSKAIFKEQVQWAVRGGADYMIAETFNDLGEAKLALEAIQKYGNGMPAVVTLAAYSLDITTDDVPFPQALRELEEMGADVVGLNCGRGPKTMLPLLREARKLCKGPLAALPSPFRTTPTAKSFHALKDPITGERLFPLDLSSAQCNRSDIRAFAREARDMGIQYIGLCCGSSSFLIREIAVEYGRTPPSMKYAPDIARSFHMGGLYKRSAKVWAHMTGEQATA